MRSCAGADEAFPWSSACWASIEAGLTTSATLTCPSFTPTSTPLTYSSNSYSPLPFSSQCFCEHKRLQLVTKARLAGGSRRSRRSPFTLRNTGSPPQHPRKHLSCTLFQDCLAGSNAPTQCYPCRLQYIETLTVQSSERCIRAPTQRIPQIGSAIFHDGRKLLQARR